MQKRKVSKILWAICLFAMLALFLGGMNTRTAFAQPKSGWKPPKLISLAAISIRSTGFAAGTGLVSTITDKTGVKFRIEPAPTSIDRAERVKSGQVEFSLSAGGHAYTLQTGKADFDIKGWGNPRCQLGYPFILSIQEYRVII